MSRRSLVTGSVVNATQAVRAARWLPQFLPRRRILETFVGPIRFETLGPRERAPGPSVLPVGFLRVPAPARRLPAGSKQSQALGSGLHP